MLREPISSSSSSVFELVLDFPPYLKHILPFPVWHWYTFDTPRGGSAYKGLYEVAPAGRGTVFQASGIWKGREICCLIWNFRRRKNLKGLYCEKLESISWFCDLFIFNFIYKTVHRQHLKGMHRSKLGTWKRYHLSMKGIWKGYLFCQKWYIKGKGWDLGVEPPGIKLYWVPATGVHLHQSCS